MRKLLALVLLSAWLGGVADASKRWVSAGGVVFNKRGQIALVKQAAIHGKREKWTFPKGKVDPGEGSRTAALRETNEEGGLKAQVTGFYGRHKSAAHFTDYYRMSLIKDRGTHDHEIKKVKFVSLEKAGKMLESKRDLAVLELAKEGKLVSTRGSTPRKIR